MSKPSAESTVAYKALKNRDGNIPMKMVTDLTTPPGESSTFRVPSELFEGAIAQTEPFGAGDRRPDWVRCKSGFAISCHF
jgi:hypothetical protein